MSRRRKNNLLARYYLPAALVLVVLATLIGAYIFIRSITAPITREEVIGQEFVIERGDTTLEIADNLYAAGLIRSPLGFRYVVKKHSLGSKLQAGSYQLTPTLNALGIATTLTHGVNDLSVTIPEGYRLEEIAATLESKIDLSRSEFLALAKGQEGYLFPDTYYFAPSSSAQDVISIMQNTFESRVGEIDYNTLILASLIERETAGDAEKPVVAGILMKRLESGWALELDATVQYVLGTAGEWWPNTTLADRQSPSPYNTYLNQGLPPTPICNPGLESINAARNPEASDYWFYLHGRDGQIHYGRTLEEHNQNIAKYIH